MSQKQEYNITVYTENHIGIIAKLSIIFSRRKINIESMNTSPSEVDGIHRFGILINETREVVVKLCKQIEKQIDIIKVYFNTNDEIIWQEMALYKVPTKQIAERALVERLLRQHGARVVVIRNDYIIFEATGHREETNGLIDVLSEFGLIEFVRSARVGIIKSSAGFHDELKKFERNTPSEEITENEYLDKGDEIFTM